jgi:short-subunit dehydrogenase
MTLNGVFTEKYGPWALVTGASSCIGKEFARQLAAHSMNLVLVARRLERLDEIAKELRDEHGIQTRTIQADLSQPESIAAIEQASQDLDIGLLVSNARTGIWGAFLKSDVVAETRLINLNVTAHMQLAYAFGQRLSQRGRGGIILVSSIGAYQGMPYMASYSAAKAYILNLGEALYFELKDQGVDVTVLAPGMTDTDVIHWEGMAETPKSPVPFMKVGPVVEAALQALGKKASVVPGGMNKVMRFITTRVMSRVAAASVYGHLMQQVVAPGRL